MDQAPDPATITPPEAGIPTETTPPKPPRRRRRTWRRVVGLLVLLLVLAVAWRWWEAHERAEAAAAAHKAPPGVPVTVAIAKKGTVNVYLNEIGTVTPVYTDIITPQATGMVMAVHYREGQSVHTGDPLVDIDDRTYAAQLEQAQGTLARDQALLAEAQMDLVRYQQAWAANAIQRQTLDDQAKVVAQDQGTVINDEGTVRYDQVELGYCHIASPINGRVGLRLVDPGNAVAAGQTTPLVVITQMQPITVIFTVSEDNLGEIIDQIRAGKRMAVTAWDRAQQHLLASGALESIDNQIDTTTGTVKLRADFANSKEQLYPNEFVNARLLVRTLTNQTLIPTSAVQYNGTQAYVYVIENGKAALQNVTAGVTQGGDTAVTGVAPGATVANSSFDKLENGAPVTISTAVLPTNSTEMGPIQ